MCVVVVCKLEFVYNCIILRVVKIDVDIKYIKIVYNINIFKHDYNSYYNITICLKNQLTIIIIYIYICESTCIYVLSFKEKCIISN